MLTSVDLRVRPVLLVEFVECRIDDVGEERAMAIGRDVAEKNDLNVGVDRGEPDP